MYGYRIKIGNSILFKMTFCNEYYAAVYLIAKNCYAMCVNNYLMVYDFILYSFHISYIIIHELFIPFFVFGSLFLIKFNMCLLSMFIIVCRYTYL